MMINELIKLASHLDKKDFYREANYLDAAIKKYSSEEDSPEGAHNLISKFALILETQPPPDLDDLISEGQQKYSDILPEGESFAKINKSHVTLIPGQIFKTISKNDQEAIIEKLRESTVLTPIIDTENVYLATREMEGRKTLYLKLDNSEPINGAVREAVFAITGVEVPNKYMHMSIANVHGGNSYQSVGDIKEEDEYDENKVIVSAVQQQKKKEKPPQQKKKGGPGDLVKRLKGAGMPDDKIREILSKAHPNLPERAVDNMLENITASNRSITNGLIKLATHLDNKGFHKEADYLDAVMRKYAEDEEEEKRVIPWPAGPVPWNDVKDVFRGMGAFSNPVEKDGKTIVYVGNYMPAQKQLLRDRNIPPWSLKEYNSKVHDRLMQMPVGIDITGVTDW